MKSAAVVMLLTIHGIAPGQVSERDVHEIGISIPAIYNHSEATVYQLGRARFPHGQATSYGIAFDYTKGIFDNVYGILGSGYFKQVFGISRPFYYTSFTQPIFSTKWYKYDNLHLYAGVGYRRRVGEKFFVRAKATYNWFNAFRQKYSLSRESHEVNRRRFSIGSFAMVGAGMEKTMSEKMSVGVEASYPVGIRWKNDPMFFTSNNDFAGDAQQIARNRFSAGLAVMVKYHL